MASSIPETLAGQPDVLPLNELTLIGLFLGPEGGSALLRAPSGDIAQVGVGETAFGVVLTALDDSQAIVTDAKGAAFALQMPGV